MLEQHRLDFGQLDPIATELHLVVDPPEELELSVLIPSDQVTCFVEAQAPRRPLPVCFRRFPLNERPLRELGLVQIPARQSRAGYIKFTFLTGRHRPHILVQDMDFIAPQRPANGYGPPGSQDSSRGVHSCLCRAVDIQHLQPRTAPAVDEVRRASLATDDELPERGYVLR